MSNSGSIDPRRAPAPLPAPSRRALQPLHLTSPALHPKPEDDLDLRAAWDALARYRGMIASLVTLAVLSTLGVSFLMPPEYRARSLLEIRPHAEQLVRFEERVPDAPIGVRELMETQSRILSSESVVDRVIERLELQAEPELLGRGQHGVVDGALALLRAIRTETDPDPTLESWEVRRNFRERLSVVPVRDSNLIEVRFDSRKAQLAADVVNALVEEYTRLNQSQWSRAASSAKSFLQDEIARAEDKLRESELELIDFARRHDIVDVDERTDLLNTRVTELNAELTAAIQSRVQAEVLDDQVVQGRGEELDPVLKSALIQSLKEELAKLTAEYERLARIYKPGYPRLRQLAAQIREVEANRSREEKRLLSSVRAEHERARSREALLTAEVEKEKVSLLDLKDRAVEYHILKREWETNRELHAGLLEQMKRAGVMAGIGPNQAVLIDPARIPVKPERPRPFLYAGVAGGLSLVLGALLAFLRAHFDDRVRSAEDLEMLTGLLPLAEVPEQEPALLVKQGGRISARQQRSGVAQAVRSLRTHLAVGTAPGALRLLQVTSAWASEGKTTTAVNLAVVLAQRGSRILLVDADLRRPCVHTLFTAARGPGLAELLQGSGGVRPYATAVPQLSILPAGQARQDPADLLGSLNLPVFFEDARQAFDYVIVDSPPVLGPADATLLSGCVDGVLLVAAVGTSRRATVQEATRRLRLAHSPLFGAVLNRADERTDPYGYRDDDPPRREGEIAVA